MIVSLILRTVGYVPYEQFKVLHDRCKIYKSDWKTTQTLFLSLNIVVVQLYVLLPLRSDDFK